MFWKEGRLRVGIWPFGVVKYGEWRYVWRIVLCHIRWVTIFCRSFSVEVWWGVSCLFQRKVWENVWQTFSRPSKLLILEGTFAISEVSLCFLVGLWWPYCIFSSDHLFSLKHSCSVHFCLINLVMISQTAQCWSTDGVFSSLRSEKEIFGIGKWAFDCVCLLSSCSSVGFWTVLDA